MSALLLTLKIAAILYVTAVVVTIPYLVASESHTARRIRRTLHIP